ncbi:hypothetical protein PAXINDRAFT_17310 [Paxillus involutus ATCC 200175]|uniref:Uncharacterized protein n=1 Tax=Paxillus involutus ATCC 200175 TaxID=664439 RepID=A0A0C9T1N5_PAXIN|nr:hypothetical protein PAXINDRAFT_17310 [Paxillus involutus ATCC 200175]
MADIPVLRTDGRNWTEYREKLLRVAAQQKLDKLYDGTETLQGDAEDWQQRNTIAKSLIFFEALKNLFEQDIATLELLRELRNNRTKREAAYSPQTANDRVRTRNVGDASRCDDDVSNRSVRRNDHVSNGNTRRPERKREPKRQGRVEKRPGVGEEGRESRGRDDEKAAAATGPGKGATDHTADGVSLVKPTSSLPRAQVDSPLHHHNSQSPPQSHITPILLFKQTAPARNGHVPRIETRRTREDVEWSWRGAESSNRGSREPDDEDGEDVDVHRADVAPQQPQTVGQTAVDDEAADTTDPHANSAGPAVPVGTSNGPSNGIDEGVEEGDRKAEEEDEKGGRASESAALSSNDDGGDEDVRHAYVVPKPAPPSPYHVPPPPDENRPPPSMSLKGEMSGKQSSDHADEAATHLERPPDESTTTPPVWTPPDEKSSGEGRGTAMSHREAVGGDNKVEGSNDGRDTSNRVNEWRRREDEARDDEERQENREEEVRMGDEAERHNDAADGEVHRDCTTEGVAEFLAGTSIEGEDEHSPRTPPQPPPSSPLSPPPPVPPTSPPHPERHDVVDHMKSNKTAARARADALHDQEGETVSPGSVPPSVRLEGERIRLTSPYIEVDDVEATTPDSKPPSIRLKGESGKQSSLNVKSTDVEDDPDDQTTPRDPAGMQDGDMRPPNGPTEPPDEEKGADGGYGEQEVESTIKHVETTEPGRVEVEEVKHVEGVEDVKDVETNASRRVDEPGDEEVEELRSRGVEGETGGQSEDDGCQRDGRTCDTGGATSGTSHDSKRVRAGPLAEDEASQQRNGKPSMTKHVPGPPTPHPSDTTRPTHLANPPRHRGRLKSPPTNVSQPERTEYAPRRTVESTTTQANRMRRKRCRATGGVSQSHHSRGRSAPRPVRRHRTPSTSPIPPNYHIG